MVLGALADNSLWSPVVYNVHKTIAKIMDAVHMMQSMTSPLASNPPARSTYRHGDLRRALLEAGVELARSGGLDAVVLREATRRAGVVPNEIGRAHV